MKSAIIGFACIAVMTSCFAQEPVIPAPGPVLTKQDYLIKSKHQKKGAIILVSAGGALAFMGIFIATNDLDYNLNPFGGSDPYDNPNENETLAAGLIVAGGVAMLSSIALFVSAHKNKKKAMAISFKYEPAELIQRNTISKTAIPSINLRISL